MPADYVILAVIAVLATSGGLFCCSKQRTTELAITSKTISSEFLSRTTERHMISESCQSGQFPESMKSQV